ncbi:MAG: methylthioribulose 1-phosphate dehydratase [Nitrospirota bacterium]
MTASRPSDHAVGSTLCEFLRLFYDKGWVAGTGGGICGALEDGTMLMAPTGVHKERVTADDLFRVDRGANVVSPPKTPGLRLTECSTIFCAIAEQHKAGSVMHSHGLSAVLAADLAQGSDRVLIRDLEMLKGIRGCTNSDVHAVPVVDNTAREPELVAGIRRALDAPEFQRAACVLVRHHGAYIWGQDLWEAKRHAEVYHFLFEAVVARSRRG